MDEIIFYLSFNELAYSHHIFFFSTIIYSTTHNTPIFLYCLIRIRDRLDGQLGLCWLCQQQNASSICRDRKQQNKIVLA